MRHYTTDKSQEELFKSRLSNQIDMRHELIKLSEVIDWHSIEQGFTDEKSPDVGRIALPVRLMVGLLLLQYMYDLSDTDVVRAWKENPYWQYFCGYDYLQLDFPADPSTLTRWRNRMGKDKLDRILQVTVNASVKSGAVKVKDLKSVTVDTTVMPKNIEFPTDSKLIANGIRKIVSIAQKMGVPLKQNYKFVVKKLERHIGKYFHAKQINRARKCIAKLKTIGGRIVRDCERKIGDLPELQAAFSRIFRQMAHLIARQKDDKNKIYSLHEEEAVSCISKGKAHKQYEFGCKVALSIANSGTGVVTSAKSFHDNPYDGHTLRESLEHSHKITGIAPSKAFVDKGYKGHRVTETKVFISGQTRGVTSTIKRKLKRRQAIEPHIGHMKNSSKLGLCRLKGITGDRTNLALCAAAYNLRLIMNHLRDILCNFWELIFVIEVRQLNLAR